MRIVLFGVAPWIQSAYGITLAYLASSLAESYEVDIAAYYGINEGKISYEHGELVALTGGPQNWADQLKDLKADLIIQHFDIWIMPPDWIETHQLPVITFSPVDGSPLAPQIAKACSGALENVAMSRFAERMYSEAGLNSTYIPHFYNQDTFQPQNKEECRAYFGLPKDVFIYGFVGTNRSNRKNIINQIYAYKKAIEINPSLKEKSKLFLHTYLLGGAKNPEGYNLASFINKMDLSDNILHTESKTYWSGFSDGDLAKLYNCFDVLLSCSNGEGFCIPIIEAQGCGVPVIGADNSAITEVVGDGGIIVPCNNFVPMQKTTTWHSLASIEDMTDAILKIYEDEEYRKDLSERAIKNASQYRVSKVVPKWVELIEKIRGRSLFNARFSQL